MQYRLTILTYASGEVSECRGGTRKLGGGLPRLTLARQQQPRSVHHQRLSALPYLGLAHGSVSRSAPSSPKTFSKFTDLHTL